MIFTFVVRFFTHHTVEGDVLHFVGGDLPESVELHVGPEGVVGVYTRPRYRGKGRVGDAQNSHIS